MSFESEQVCLADVCSDVSYGYTEGATAQPIGPKFLRITDIQGGSFDWSTVPFCPATEDNVRKYQLQVGDIVVARTGNSTGENAQVVQEPPAAVFASYLIRFRPNSGRVNPFFVGYQLRSERFKQHVLAVRGGSAQPGANAKQLGAFTFHLIPRNLQDEAVESLRTLDDRIALLRETNATLEAIAQALFKSWFVDFDPVHAKARGEQPEALPEPLAALFPDSFEESPLGLVPRGWGWCKMDDVSTVGIGKTPPRKEPQWFSESPADVPWVSIKDMGQAGAFINQTGEFLTREAVDRFNVRVVPNNTVLLSFKLTVGRLSITTDRMVTNEAIAHFKLDADSPISSEYIYLALKNFNFGSLSSTSSIAEAVNSKTVKSLPILVPSPRTAAAFDEHVGPLFARIRLIENQAQTLSTLRDTLLPRLISGQLRLPEAEAVALAA